MDICTVLRYIFCKDKGHDFTTEVDRVQEIKRLKYALSPIIRHADAHEFAPPLRLSVQDCKKIKESINA